jgi:hypothetical protein
MRTIRRSDVRRLAEAGQLEAVDSYHFDDMLGESRGLAKPLPVAMRPADWHDRKEGVFYVSPSDFASGSGACWLNENDTITLIVHSNCNYTFRVCNGGKVPVPPKKAVFKEITVSPELAVKLARFAAVLHTAQLAGLAQMRVDCEANNEAVKTRVKLGRKYANVDIGSSGRYMVELETGTIYGIKDYGTINRYHRFGTLDTIEAWDWSGYYASPLAEGGAQ